MSLQNHDEIEAIVRKVVAEMFAPLLGNQPEPTEQWMSLRQAWKILGYPSYDALYGDVHNNVLFREGKEVCDRRKPGAKIARLQIDIVAARKRLKQDPSMRRAV
jgi:hypothetical protein